MDLNNTEFFKELDQENMIGHINNLPDQLTNAWEIGQKSDLPAWTEINKIVVSGMGGSAIGADLLASYIEPNGTVPIILHRDYDLPAWASGEDTLVICSSYSGNTEETLSAFAQAKVRGCKILAVATGGKLAEQAKALDNAAVWSFDYKSQPRAAVGYSFTLLLAAYSRLGFLADPGAELKSTVLTMKEEQEVLRPEVPDTENSAKRLAGQLYGRWITIFGAGLLAPVARRWKGQINEVAKAQAALETLPEADHNTLQGVMQPEDGFGKSMSIFLRSTHNHERNQLRDEFTRMGMMLEGINTDFFLGKGSSRLADMWTTLHYGDYTSYYLAMAYGIDPTPVPMLIDLKGKMAAA